MLSEGKWFLSTKLGRELEERERGIPEEHGGYVELALAAYDNKEGKAVNEKHFFVEELHQEIWLKFWYVFRVLLEDLGYGSPYPEIIIDPCPTGDTRVVVIVDGKLIINYHKKARNFGHSTGGKGERAALELENLLQDLREDLANGLEKINE